MTIYETKQICIKTNKGVLSIDPSDILYCTLSDGYSQIVLKSNEHIKTKLSLKKLEDKFKKFCFVRCHAKYLTASFDRFPILPVCSNDSIIHNITEDYKPDIKLNEHGIIAHKAPLQYTYVFTTNKLIYALYVNKTDKQLETLSEPNLEIHSFKWDTTPFMCLRLDKAISAFCIDEKNKTLYGINPFSENNQIIKFNLENLKLD